MEDEYLERWSCGALTVFHLRSNKAEMARKDSNSLFQLATTLRREIHFRYSEIALFVSSWKSERSIGESKTLRQGFKRFG